MRKCGNKCLYRRVLAGALSVLLAVGTGACGGKAETGTGQAEVLTQGAEAGTGSAAQSANGSDIELQQAGSGQSGSAVSAAPVWNDMQPERSMELSYAKQFSVDYYAGGYDLIQVQDDSTYLVVPEGAAVPEGLPASITVLQKPLDHVYLAATSAMDLIAALDRTDRITLSGTKESGWYGEAQLEQLKIPVFVERSSYETHPLGRMEWIRLYGVLFDEEEKAEQLLKEQAEQLDTVLIEKSTGKTVAFFYITTNGAVNVRKPGDYVAKMIELAGGSYVPQTADADENALSTMNMQMEAFYAETKDADCLIYNSTIDGELQTLDELLQKNPLLADFKAVKNGNVWCTGKNMFQETMGLGNMILDMHAVLSEDMLDEAGLHYLHRLR